MRSQSFVQKLASCPLLFDLLRWILEWGFKGEKEVLREQGILNGWRVLDLGCGTGALAGMFNPRNYLGVDCNSSYIGRARKKHPHHRFLIMDGCNLALGSGSFDQIIIGGVLHHLPDREALRLLAETRRVLNPEEGRLILWEDIPTRNRFNILGKMVQHWDRGSNIRPASQYLQLIQPFFTSIRDFPMGSGVCDYLVVVAQ